MILRRRCVNSILVDNDIPGIRGVYSWWLDCVDCDSLTPLSKWNLVIVAREKEALPPLFRNEIYAWTLILWLKSEERSSAGVLDSFQSELGTFSGEMIRVKLCGSLQPEIADTLWSHFISKTGWVCPVCGGVFWSRFAMTISFRKRGLHFENGGPHNFISKMGPSFRNAPLHFEKGYYNGNHMQRQWQTS
jgi:hypothetical protein